MNKAELLEAWDSVANYISLTQKSLQQSDVEKAKAELIKIQEAVNKLRGEYAVGVQPSTSSASGSPYR